MDRSQPLLETPAVMPMKQLAACLATIALAGCSTLGQWREQPATPELLEKMGGVDSATFTLHDGRVERITVIRDFGNALCGNNACIRKADIAKIGYAPRQVDVAGSLLLAPLLPVIAVGKAVACYPSCGYPDQPLQGPRATPQQTARAWLESLIIREGLIVHTGKPNPCVPPSPAAPLQPLATDAEAIAWITDNRTRVRTACLEALNSELDERDRWVDVKAHRDARMRISTLLAVRERWQRARCEPGENQSQGFDQEWVRIVPGQQHDLARGRGDPALLAIIIQTLEDPETYANDADVLSKCAAVMPQSRWPDRLAWASRASPFAAATGQ